MSTTTPHMPALQPSTSYSFYPYPVKTIPATSLRGPVPPTQAEAGPSRNRQTERQRATRIRERAEKRALIGQRPAGLAVGRDSEDLDLEEMALDDERVSLDRCDFGSVSPDEVSNRSICSDIGSYYLLEGGRRRWSWTLHR
jgi:hypothetical protein